MTSETQNKRFEHCVSAEPHPPHQTTAYRPALRIVHCPGWGICPEWICPDLSQEDLREQRSCPDHPCTCLDGGSSR